ncbi:MAG TPA: 23S rRNA (adenine(2503)-C(2))-methyltransferase RlmN [Spirochaetia bacterium]|nr:MAG: 23S rRNA (adenine(2503)-C(2))-methyltransferase [Spirochaetes bacterium GWB1_36_13]HCL55645.1 23S rRNA (adenine(2503)-C(2))-methyltransferase RlmN [Spirochaetia bacterium]
MKTAFQYFLPREMLSLAQDNGFRRNQVFQFYKKFYKDSIQIDEIEGLSKELIGFLKTALDFPTLEIVYSKEDSEGNGKIGFKTNDGHIIESVILARDNETSICISTQVGCKMNCAFCATAQLGFTRNLEVWEMVEQVRLSYFHFLKGKKTLTHITIMGMGEPMENFDAVYRAFQIFIHPFIYMIAAKKVTIATSGYLPGMMKLLEKKVKPSLTISFHAPNQELREKLLPIAKKYPIEQIMDYIKNYPLKKNKRLSIQYLLLKDINDKPEHAIQLAQLFHGLPVKFNFLKYNTIEFLPFEPSDEKTREFFIDTMRESGLSSLKRKSFGGDIKAACGQLGYELLTKKKQGESA